jgi:hypothetical protein
MAQKVIMSTFTFDLNGSCCRIGPDYDDESVLVFEKEDKILKTRPATKQNLTTMLGEAVLKGAECFEMVD